MYEEKELILVDLDLSQGQYEIDFRKTTRPGFEFRDLFLGVDRTVPSIPVNYELYDFSGNRILQNSAESQTLTTFHSSEIEIADHVLKVPSCSEEAGGENGDGLGAYGIFSYYDLDAVLFELSYSQNNPHIIEVHSAFKTIRHDFSVTKDQLWVKAWFDFEVASLEASRG